ncbi:hypothetical protein B0H14DRAFT_819462 [Mycena olivaceomarginata]|nr:hypothetical protein B0H14DRAFT_819462 [Mycena olivaceomarginata]
MPVDRSPIIHSPDVVKRKKPPACDSCKARRVLCHPTTDGTPCPRCIEKGTKCTTTPVARGRPPKPNLGTVTGTPSTSTTASEEPEVLSDSPSNKKSMASRDSSQYLELPPELVHHLFECFTHLPQHNHPMFRGDVLRDALSSVSWQIHLLPPQLKVLAHCVVALSASISFDHAIIGPGPKPASLADRSVFARGADLRDYGVRRAPMYRTLCAEALRLAGEVGIFLEPSEDNAASCFLLQFFENEKEARSRPWAVACLSHVRAICDSWVHTTTQNEIWTGFLLLEVLESTFCRQPITVSHHDQLLITEKNPLGLQDLFVSLQRVVQERKEKPLIPFTTMQPYLFHVTRLARELYETITGNFARRYPLDESSITDFISSLNHLHSIRSLVFDEEDEEDDVYPGDALFHPTPQKRGHRLNLRSCAYIMTLSRATLVLALHRELIHRAAITSPATAATTSADHWAAERLALLRRQVSEMADITVSEVARALRSMPSLPHIAHIQRGNVVAWAEFCLNEADAAGSVSPERAATIETISEALKLTGYSWPVPSGLVERLDAYAETHRPLPAGFSEDSMFLDMFPAPLDHNWMSVFTVSLGNEIFPQDGYS